MKRNTKQEIIESAIALIADNPFENPSLADIVSSVGISKAAVYRHFKSKKELDDEIRKQIESELSELFAFSNLNSDDLAPILKKIIIFSVRKNSHMKVIFTELLRNSYIRSKLFSILCGKGYKEDTTASLFLTVLLGSHIENIRSERKEFKDSDAEKLVSHLMTCFDNGILDLPELSSARIHQIYIECNPDDEDIKEDKYLTALSNIILKHGVTAITIKNIAQELGQAESTLYSKFTTKEEMIEYTGKKEMKNLLTPLEKVMGRYEKDEEKLIAMFSYIMNYIALSPELTCYILMLSYNLDAVVKENRTLPEQFTSFLESIPVRDIYLKHDSDVPHLKTWCFGMAVVQSLRARGITMKDREHCIADLYDYIRNGIHIDYKENI